MRLQAQLLVLPSVFLLLSLSGCANQAGIVTAKGAVQGVPLSGKVFGGQQAVTGSSIQMYAAGTAGTGSGATALISKVITTSDGTGLVNPNANTGNNNNGFAAGAFTITGDYTCPSAESQVYIVATGGNPGLVAGTNNKALAEMIALGSCGQLKANTNLFLDEVTTVGSLAAIYPYATGYNSVGSTIGETTALADEFSVGTEYMNMGTGLAPGPNLPSGYYASSTEINTLADVVASCVNSVGGKVSGGVSDGTPCGNFFLAAKPSSVMAPSDTIGAVIDILKNPTNNVSSIYGMQSSTPPFEPTLSTAPSDWTLPIVPLPQAPYALPVPSAYVAGQAVTLTSVTSGATIHYTTDGSTPTASSMTYTSAISVPASATVKAIAVNRAGVSAATTAAYTITGAAGTPVISPGSGTFTAQQLITIASPTADAAVYATVDGTTPTTASLLVTGPLQVDKTETVRAIAVAGSSTSGTASAAFVFAPATRTINTFAGGGTNLGVTAGTVSLVNPTGLAMDLSGNVYVADGFSQVVRKLTVATGIVTTIAGGGGGCAGQTDAYGDGCAGTSAILNQPLGVAVDASGNVYIADEYNYVIRKVTAATGVITTIAGGGANPTTCSGSKDAYGDGCVATSAAFGNPSGVAVNAGGDIYFSDIANNLVFKVAAGTGVLSIAAGGGANPTTCSGSTDSLGDGCLATSATVNYPGAIALDGSGDLYITDGNNLLVRRVSATTGVMTTVAGNGAYTYNASQNGGPATSAAIYPSGLTVDVNGNIYLLGFDGNIREVAAATGTISLVAGEGTYPVTCAGATDVYGDGCVATTAVLGGRSLGIAVDGGGNVTFAESQIGLVRRVTAATGIISVVAGTLTTGTVPVQDGVAATSAVFRNVPGTALDSKGNVYVVDESNSRIREVVAGTGIVKTVVGGGANPSTCTGSTDAQGDGCVATNATLLTPLAVAVDASNNLYIVDNNEVRKVNASTGVITTVVGGGSSPNTCTGHTDAYGDGCQATSAALGNPFSVAVDSNGNIYVTDANNNSIRKVTAATGVITLFAGAGTNPSTCSGHTDSIGDGCAATSATFGLAYGLAVDASNNVYIADYTSNLVRKVTVATGVITLVAGGGTSPATCTGSTDGVGDGCVASKATLATPGGLAVDAGGNVYISELSGNAVRKVAAGTDVITTYAGNRSAGFAGDLGPATAAELNQPIGLAIDASGNLYIADSTNSRVRVVYP